MNPDTNSFEPVTEETPPEWMRAKVGEIVAVKNYLFRVETIEPDRLVLVPHGESGSQWKQGRAARRRARQLARRNVAQFP